MACEHSFSVSQDGFPLSAAVTPVLSQQQMSPMSHHHQVTNQNAQPVLQSPLFPNVDPRSSRPLLQANGHHHLETKAQSPVVLSPHKTIFTSNGSLTPYNQPLSIKIQSPPMAVSSQSFCK